MYAKSRDRTSLSWPWNGSEAGIYASAAVYIGSPARLIHLPGWPSRRPAPEIEAFLADPKDNSRPESAPTGPLPPLRPEPIDGGAAETEGWWPRPVAEVDEPFNSPRRWAGRVAFPLLALAVLLAWWGIKVNAGEPSRLPDWAWWMLAALSVMVGLAMMRIRHRRG